VNDGVVFWADGTSASVLACSVTGCNGSPTTIAVLPFSSTGNDFVTALAVDATDVYFGTSTQVLRCPRGGCPGGATLLCSAAYVQGYQEIALDAAHVYFLSADATQILALAK